MNRSHRRLGSCSGQSLVTLAQDLGTQSFF